MSLNALVVANTERSNHRVGYAITRELRLVEDVNFSLQTNLKSAIRDVELNATDFSLIIADAPSIGNDFKAAASILPNRPLILLQSPSESAITDTEVRDLGVDPDLIINRPFPLNALRQKVEAVLHDQIAPPESLRGLFTNKACTNVFFDGQPVRGLMSIERDLLMFLINNKTEEMSLDSMVNRFRDTTPGMSHYDDTSVSRVLDNFSGRLAKRMPELTGKTYELQRQQDEQKKFTGCKLVSKM